MSLEDLRNRNKSGKLDRLLKAASKTSAGKKSFNNDQEETFYPERDKNGNGSCIIRFLPGLESEDFPYYVERHQHGFSHNNKWFIEFCPSTIGNDCPVCEDNFDTIGEYGKWKDCPKNIQNIIRKRGRNAGFRAGNYCNVLVIKDPANPENEGKVHLFKFGKGIMDMIMDMAQPQDDGLGDTPDPVDVFDLVDGANFKFIIFKKEDRADYSKSKFEDPSECPDFDIDTQQSLLPIIDEKLFKSYDELSDRLNKVLSNKPSNRATRTASDAVDSDDNRKKKTDDKKKSSGKKSDKKDNDDVDNSDDNSDDDSDDDSDNMAYFQDIADDITI